MKSSVGPLYEQGPGDITRWMAVPWQTDTASCRSGYDKKYDPWLPTFWAVRVPNHVLTEQDYHVVVDESRPRAERLQAFDRRASWYRILGEGYLNQIRNMVDLYGDLGVVGYRPGIEDDPDFPPAMYVELPPGTMPPDAEACKPHRQRLLAAMGSDSAADVASDRGLYVGKVAKVVRKR